MGSPSRLQPGGALRQVWSMLSHAVNSGPSCGHSDPRAIEGLLPLSVAWRASDQIVPQCRACACAKPVAQAPLSFLLLYVLQGTVDWSYSVLSRVVLAWRLVDSQGALGDPRACLIVARPPHVVATHRGISGPAAVSSGSIYTVISQNPYRIHLHGTARSN